MLSQNDYEFLASHAVDKYIRGNTPLNESIVKIAEVNDLNSDQIKRVVEIANTKTFLKMFKEAENKGKDIDFDVADVKNVLKDYYKAEKSAEAKDLVKIAAEDDSFMPYEFEQSFSDMLRNTRHPDPGPVPQEFMEKQAEAPKPKKHVVIYRLKKVAGDMYETILTKEQEYQSMLDKIGVELRKSYNSPLYEDVEKTAMLTLEGVEPILNDIRERIRWTKDKFSLEKNAEHRHLVDTNDSYYKIVEAMYQTKVAQVKYAKAYKLTKSKIKKLAA